MFNDRCATGVLDVLRRAGQEVPRDVSVVGFDDSALATQVHPALTTVRQDVDAKARTAAAVLRDAMAANRAGRPLAVTRVLLPTELVVRDSTGPVR